MALEKLQIQSFSDPVCTQKISEPIKLFINPDNYSRNSTINYKDVNVIADSKKSLVFAGMGTDKLNLNKLIIDGTGIVPLGGYANADAYIEALRNVVYQFNGGMHQAGFIMVTWGKLKFIGVCKSFNINYVMFKPDGTTLRAFIDISFESSVDLKTKAKIAGLQSPDLTHIRSVKAGDTLPLMTFRIYGDSSYYLEVARINKLRNIHALKPGDQIYFPPLKK